MFCSEVLELTRDTGQSKFDNVTKELLYIYVDWDDDGTVERVPLFSDGFEGFLWDYDLREYSGRRAFRLRERRQKPHRLEVLEGTAATGRRGCAACLEARASAGSPPQGAVPLCLEESSQKRGSTCQKSSEMMSRLVPMGDGKCGLSQLSSLCEQAMAPPA